ncbi:retrovirus-related pol polyprotein from transposon TNT 1-94 [Tanacetum coccineum]|uniref:Retrovirus-related pol polyprotein from transposon TNT 1-94 n=1 Tax=Tanacetum coccineum TaxID=301880 RepID=A0ABQ5D5D9_9ASTR
MARMVENVTAVGSENRPLMLEKGMYDSWKTQIILYIKDRENGEMLIDLIKEGPFKLAKEITVKDTDGVTDIKRKQTPDDLSPKERLRYNSNIKAVNILLLGLPVDIYTLMNHYEIVQEIWDRVKELMEGTKMSLKEPYSSRCPPTNNQLRTSSNSRTQATIQNGHVTAQNVQGRQSQGYAGNVGKSQATGARVMNIFEEAGANQPWVIRCYNCRGEGHIAKQCTAKKRVKNSEWFKDKMLLAQAQEAGVMLHKEQQDFLADRLEENDDYCDDEATISVIFMASLSPAVSLNDDTVALTYDSDILLDVPHYNTYHDDVLNFDVQET